MQCPKCQFENPDGVNFCVECGSKLEEICPECGCRNSLSHKFCGGCGYNFIADTETSDESLATESPPFPPATEKTSRDGVPIVGERKHVTALFSDLSGYTAISEKLDPEEVKEITSRIFGDISKIVGKYDGFIEKYAGDAVMALFGVPEAHEDDPIRAIRAAREIHEFVDTISPELENRTGQPISMHTGINTGLVVTGEIDLERGTHGVAGDTINVASRLSSSGKAGEILVGLGTYSQVGGYFDFEELDPVVLRGRSEAVRVYKVLAAKEKPIKIHRLHGLRAKLIGRKVEMNHLADAVQRLTKENKGAVISICGHAGTGKSRLVEEFRSTINLGNIQWMEGHAYPYSQNIPYYPLIDLMNKMLQIEENDSSEKIRHKVQTGISSLIGKDTNLIPYIGSLFSINYPEIDEVSPEFWKAQLKKAVQTILASLSQSAPIIICIEDLHWADPSFLDLIRLILTEMRHPILFLCTYRPIISFFTSQQISNMVAPHNEIQLQDLSPIESQIMVESLLSTESIPSDLQRFVRDKIEGNPFYIEEVINSLIESEILIRDNKGWKIKGHISEADISSSIHGVISGRLDRLEKEAKRILQEASVIGRSFLYKILKKITDIKDQIDKSLSGLEQLDLIKTRMIDPDLEYIFKHALTQEVVYNGLLKKERRTIHERIGLVIEHLFQDRLPEFYETLAFHFQNGQSVSKAVHYLMKSGEKSLRMYAVQESHEYYKKAYKLIADNQAKTEGERELLFDLLIKWSLVYYYRGDFKEQTDLLKRHENEADLLNDKEKQGMFYGWLGFILQFRWELEDSYRYLQKALKLGEEAKSQRVIGYACTWLVYTLAVSDKYEEGYSYWQRAVKIAKLIKSDQYLFLKSTAGMGHLNFFSGKKNQSYEIGITLLQYGEMHSNIRSQVVGHICIGHSHFATGDLTKALSCYQKAADVAEDPFYTQWPRLYIGLCYFICDQIKESEEALNVVSSYMHEFGCEILGPAILPFLGALAIKKGDMSEGLKTIKEIQNTCIKKKWGYGIAISEYVLGNLYYEIAYGKGTRDLSFIIKNFTFLVKNVPFASTKAEDYFKRAVESAKRFGAKGILGWAYLDLGRMYQTKKQNERAKESITEAVHIFDQIGAEVYLRRAVEALEDLR